MKLGLNKALKRFVRWLDPKLAKYREPEKELAPETLEELLGLLKRTPKTVLSNQEREAIANAMSFDARKVKEIMVPREDVLPVYEYDVLGPLMLDKLYRSGNAHFPVLDKAKNIVGILHTDSLNSLKIKETDQAKKYLDKNVYFVGEDYSLEQALAAFLRTNCYFFVVVNKAEEVVGLLDCAKLLGFLLGHVPSDDFSQDDNRHAVAQR